MSATTCGTRRALLAVALFGVLVSACGGSTARRAAAPPTRPPTTAAPTSSAPSTSTTTAPSTPTPTPGPDHPCGSAAAPPAHYQHVVWIWMENHAWSDVIGSSDAPFLTGLAQRCGTATQWSDVGSPSLPNYLGATSGTTFGISDDDDPASHRFSADNLFRQVRSAGGTERSFVESMPQPCDPVTSGQYAARHNPAVYYDGPGDQAACQTDDVGLGQLDPMLAAGTLPTFTSITPNVCNDMHDCSVATGDQWLATWIPKILASTAYRSGTTALIVVFDEPSPVANVVIAPSVRPGVRSSAPVSHYALLRTTEELLSLPFLGAAAGAPSLRPIFGL